MRAVWWQLMKSATLYPAQCVYSIYDSTFKYISCYSLSGNCMDLRTQCSTFKYISCYSLSTGASSRFFSSLNLNTSHVILYPFLPITPTINVPSFKYISCYSLSEDYAKVPNSLQNLNTSHVILYRLTAEKYIISHTHLNTSHVILYLYPLRT